MKHLSVLLVAAAFGSTLVAQQNIIYVPNATPSGVRNAFPFGAQTGVRQQVLVPGTALGAPGLIQDIFVAHMGPSATSPILSGELVYGDFEINMSVVSTNTLSSIWTQNLPNPTQVQKGRLRMRWQSGAWTPLGLERPFLWLPLSPTDNLVVDMILWNLESSGGIPGTGYIMNTAADATVQRNWLLNWPTSQGNATVGLNGTKFGFLLGDGNFVGRGFGCTTTTSTTPATSMPTGTWPRIGQSMTLELSQAAPNSVANPLIGLSERMFGAIPLPLDLGFAGATGCMLWVDPLAILPALVTNSTGYTSFSMTLPNDPTLVSARLRQSWIMLDLGGPRLVTSDFGLLIIGS